MQVFKFFKFAFFNFVMELSFDATPIFEFSTEIVSNCTKDFSPTDKALSLQLVSSALLIL